MSLPSKRNRLIAKQRAAGVAYAAIAAEFKISTRRVRKIAEAVARYDRGLAYLHADPWSLEGLELTGGISQRVRKSLEAKGIWRLKGLDGMNLKDLLKLPNISRGSAATLFRLYAELRVVGKRDILSNDPRPVPCLAAGRIRGVAKSRR